MIKLNRILVPMMVLMAVGLLITGGYILLDKESTKSPENNGKNETPWDKNMSQNDSWSNPYYIEETVEVLSPDTVDNRVEYSNTVLITNLTQNVKPEFSVGDRFVYEHLIFSTEPGIEFPNFKITHFESYKHVIEYHVVGKVRMDKINYFKIHRYSHSFVVGIMTTKEGSEPMIIGEDNRTIYINADTGELFEEEKCGMSQCKDKRILRCFFEGCLFDPWMLALDDDIKWRETSDLIPGERKYFQERYGEKYEEKVRDFSVDGREKISGRECFRVKEEDKLCSKQGGCKILSKRIYYVDVENRILLEFEVWLENLRIKETKLLKEQSLMSH